MMTGPLTSLYEGGTTLDTSILESAVSEVGVETMGSEYSVVSESGSGE